MLRLQYLVVGYLHLLHHGFKIETIWARKYAYKHMHMHAHTKQDKGGKGFLSTHSAIALGLALILIFSHKLCRYKRVCVTAQMKNKFLLFSTISSAFYYHTDRSVTFLPVVLEANEKSPDEK